MSANIATVIVNWNKKADVLDLLYSLRNVKHPSFDIFVVDNASTDGSADAIEADFPEINLIKNETNLGGTGGFNTGVRYVCNLDRYDYIWLLDNDVKVTDNTLYGLVSVIKSDDRIGMVGSHVMDIDNRAVTVEMGGKIRLDIMGVTPLYRNTIYERKDSAVVDYVAICSALASIKAIKKVGLMDDRLFLFWDDMDWGIYFNEYGYKVIAASKSIVYHGSFTERQRGPATNYYYGIRNPLLVYSKHTSFIKLLKIFYHSSRYYSKIYFFLSNHGKRYEARLIYKAFSDYINNRWGKLSLDNRMKTSTDTGPHPDDNASMVKNRTTKILISTIPGVTFQDCMAILQTLMKNYKDAQITILTYNDRADYFKDNSTYILDRKKMNNLFYLIRKSLAIKRKRFDAIAYMIPAPFIYLGKSTLLVDKDGNVLAQKHTNSFSLIKLCLLTCLSEIVALIILPVLLFKSRHYKASSDQ